MYLIVFQEIAITFLHKKIVDNMILYLKMLLKPCMYESNLQGSFSSSALKVGQEEVGWQKRGKLYYLAGTL